MASNVDFLVAFLLGILPAIGILWTSLRRFDRPYVDRTLFDDRRVFGSLAVGLVFGTIASVFALSIPRTDIVGVLAASSPTFLFEEAFKLVWLNRRRYQGRFDTTFYGVPLGTGIAASGVVAAAWASRDVLYVPETFALLVLYSIGLGLVNADTGALIGFGASQGEMWRYFLRAIAVRFAYGAFLFPFILPGIPDFYAALSVTTAAGFGLLIYYYVYRRILPGTLPEELRRESRRERRRASLPRGWGSPRSRTRPSVPSPDSHGSTWPRLLRRPRFQGPPEPASNLRGRRPRVLSSVRRRRPGAGPHDRAALTRRPRSGGGRPWTAFGARAWRLSDMRRVRRRAPRSLAPPTTPVHAPCRLAPAPGTGRFGSQIHTRRSSSSVSGPRPWPVCIEGRR